jgi:hypothetical protein
MEPALLLDPVTLKDSTGVSINPASEESITLLRRILKVLESSQIVDTKQRQRVVVEAIGTNSAPASTEINATLPVTVASVTSVAGASQGPTTNAPTLSTTLFQPIWEGPVDQRWRVAEDSHISYQLGIRSRLSFT